MNDEKIFETIIVSTVNLYRTNKSTDPDLTESIVELLIGAKIPNFETNQLRKHLNRVWLFDDERVNNWEIRQCLLLAFDSLNDYQIGNELVKMGQRIDRKRRSVSI
jgi:hypothetical protein